MASGVLGYLKEPDVEIDAFNLAELDEIAARNVQH
jgi:hypothetical protein